MSVEINDVVSVSMMGGEIVGRLKYQDGSNVTLESPRLFISHGESGGGFLPVLTMTGKKDPNEVTLYNIAYMLPVSDDAEKAWMQSTSGLVI